LKQEMRKVIHTASTDRTLRVAVTSDDGKPRCRMKATVQNKNRTTFFFVFFS